MTEKKESLKNIGSMVISALIPLVVIGAIAILISPTIALGATIGWLVYITWRLSYYKDENAMQAKKWLFQFIALCMPLLSIKWGINVENIGLSSELQSIVDFDKYISFLVGGVWLALIFTTVSEIINKNKP